MGAVESHSYCSRLLSRLQIQRLKGSYCDTPPLYAAPRRAARAKERASFRVLLKRPKNASIS